MIIFAETNVFNFFFQIVSTPSVSTRKHTKLLVLLNTILLSTFCMAFAVFYLNFSDSWSIFFFMLAEVCMNALATKLLFPWCHFLVALYSVEII